MYEATSKQRGGRRGGTPVAALALATLFAACVDPLKAADEVTIADLQRQLYAMFPPSLTRIIRAASAYGPPDDPCAIVEREYLYAVVHELAVPASRLSLRRVREAPAGLLLTYAACIKIITPKWHGSGFLVSPAGDVVTCYHLVASAPTASVQTIDGCIHRVEAITAVSAIHDLALLKIRGGPFPYLVPRPHVPAAAPATQLFVLGHPQESSWALSPGRIVRWQPHRGSWLLHFDANLDKGSSGGPVVDPDGTLLAVTAYAAKLADGSQVKVGISGALVHDLMTVPGTPLTFNELNAYHHNRAAAEFLQNVYLLGEDFVSELRAAMSRVTIESLTGALPRSNPWYAPATEGRRPERVLLRNTRDCADVAAKLLLLRLVTDRLTGPDTGDAELTASVNHFRRALDQLMESVFVLDRAHGTTTARAEKALHKIRQLNAGARSSLALALATFQPPARRYQLPASSPRAYELIERLRVKYQATAEPLALSGGGT